MQQSRRTLPTALLVSVVMVTAISIAIIIGYASHADGRPEQHPTLSPTASTSPTTSQ